jgi:ferredoxin-NADP reductase/MOSC domain-containing protein YiiM
MTAKILSLMTGRLRREIFASGPRESGYVRDGTHPCLRLTRTGPEGDEIADPRGLGRENHALYLFNDAHRAFFAKMLGRDLVPGSFGENVLYEGPDETQMRIGDILTLGACEVQLTTSRIPCFKLRHYLGVDQGFPAKFSATGRTGVYARVLREGVVHAEDAISVAQSDPANATISELNTVLTRFDAAPETVARVLASPDLLPDAATLITKRLALYQPELLAGPVATQVSGWTRLSDDTAVLEIDAAGAAGFDWRPGQFVTLGVADANGTWRYRCYSLISGPPEGRLTVAVRRDVGADPAISVSAQIVGGDMTGANVKIYQPAGDFLAPEIGEKRLYIAGGIGITPILSHLRALPEYTGTSVLYIACDADAAVFDVELRDASRQGKFAYELHLTSGAGRPDLDARLRAADPEAQVFVCGPIGLIRQVRTLWASLGRPNARLHFELFEPEVAQDDDNSVAQSSVDIPALGISGQWRREHGSLLDWIETETLLRPPAACRSGLCRTCLAMLEQGTVRYPVGIVPPGGSGVLLCCARPASGAVSIRLPEDTPTETPQTTTQKETQ